MIQPRLDVRLRRRQVKPIITTQELAPRVGISHVLLNAIENGSVIVDEETIRDIIRAIDELAALKIAAGIADPVQVREMRTTNLIRKKRGEKRYERTG